MVIEFFVKSLLFSMCEFSFINGSLSSVKIFLTKSLWVRTSRDTSSQYLHVRPYLTLFDRPDRTENSVILDQIDCLTRQKIFVRGVFLHGVRGNETTTFAPSREWDPSDLVRRGQKRTKWEKVPFPKSGPQWRRSFGRVWWHRFPQQRRGHESTGL